MEKEEDSSKEQKKKSFAHTSESKHRTAANTKQQSNKKCLRSYIILKLMTNKLDAMTECAINDNFVGKSSEPLSLIIFLDVIYKFYVYLICHNTKFIFYIYKLLMRTHDELSLCSLFLPFLIKKEFFVLFHSH